jgi:transcription initiation factor TFIID subunit 6
MCAFIADGVKQHLMNLTVLNRLLLLTRALLANPDVHLAPYLQQLLPAVTTCIVTKTLGKLPGSIVNDVHCMLAAPSKDMTES